MKNLDNYRTHYCPDSGFSLISENDAEFEICNCFEAAVIATAASGNAEAEATRTNSVRAEQRWYQTLSALARVIGPGKPVQAEAPVDVQREEELVRVRKS